jgi:SAM-dependent methyltransferase
MQIRLLEVLACPECGANFKLANAVTDGEGEVVSGNLECSQGGHRFLVEDAIPRFVSRDNYAASFGYQWNRFKSEQIDSINGTGLSATRFYSETGWTRDWLKGSRILDAGCGAGRFLDVAAAGEAEVFALDISSAIDAARANLGNRKNVHFVQASIFQPPFKTGAFDGCYCIGVLQHTPDPQQALRTLPRFLRPGGRIAVTVYERKPWTKLYSKYLLRTLTRRMDKRRLLSAIKGVMPALFPVTNVLFRLPLAGRFFMFAIPVANYVHETTLTPQQRYDWAILDTFDMLSPQYDQPLTQGEIEAALSAAGVVNLKRLNNVGLNVVGEKGEQGEGGAQ